MPGSATMVSLSRPALASAASATPRRGPSDPSRAAAARSSTVPTGTPAMAMGMRPNSVSAEKRPPTSGRFPATMRHPSSAARTASGVPGSVMATKRSRNAAPMTSPIHWPTCAANASGSAVVPLFDDTMARHRVGSMPSVIAATATGSVESSTRSSMPAPWPNVRRVTSGDRLEPPMPSTSACVMPSSRHDATSASISAMCGRMASGARSHPVQSRAASACAPHAAGSPARTCPIRPRPSASAMASSTSPVAGPGRMSRCISR